MTRQIQGGEGPEHFRASIRPAQTSLISRIIKVVTKALASFLGFRRSRVNGEKVTLMGRVKAHPKQEPAKTKRVASFRFVNPAFDQLEAVRTKFDSLKNKTENAGRVLEELDKCQAELAKLEDFKEVQSLKTEIMQLQKKLQPIKQRSDSISSLEEKHADLVREADTLDATTWKLEIEKLKQNTGWEAIASKAVDKRYQAQVQKVQNKIREKFEAVKRPSKEEIQKYEAVQKQLDEAQQKLDEAQAKVTRKLVQTEIDIEDLTAKIEKRNKLEEPTSSLEKKRDKLKAKVAKKMEKLQPLKDEVGRIQIEKAKLQSLVEQEFEFKQKVSDYRHLFSELQQLESGALHREVGVSFDEKAGFERFKIFLASLNIKLEEIDYT